MNDPFWDELNEKLPRAKRGEPGWAQQRARVSASLRSGSPAPRRLAGLVAAGALAAGAFLVFRAKPAPQTPPTVSAPVDDLEFLETAPLLEHLDELQDAEELDHA